MAEAGGPTTQSGILYQNSIAALYLGRMIDPVSRPARERVAEVRVEAPTHVDDIVVIFADGHTAYIQAKENIEPRGDVWVRLWKSLQAQFNSPEFKRGKDRLVLHLGVVQRWVRSLMERASGLKPVKRIPSWSITNRTGLPHPQRRCFRLFDALS